MDLFNIAESVCNYITQTWERIPELFPHVGDVKNYSQREAVIVNSFSAIMDEQQQLISYFDKFRAEILEKLNYDSTRELLSDERKVRLAHAYLDIVSEG